MIRLLTTTTAIAAMLSACSTAAPTSGLCPADTTQQRGGCAYHLDPDQRDGLPTLPPTDPEDPIDPEDPEIGGSRSGLGDGTNPGRGRGRDRSPNIGILNPSDAPSR
jgi:hypothetical protein